MKYLKGAFYLLLLAFTFLAGALLFAPWKEAGLYTFEHIRLEAARRGYFITCERMESSGLFRPSYVLSGLEIEGPAARASMAQVKLDIFPASSLVSGRARCRAVFSDALVKYVPGGELKMTSGEFDISAGIEAVAVRDSLVEGDIGMRGDIVFDIREGAVSESTAVIKVPPLINAVLSSPALSRFVEPSGQGEWRIREIEFQSR
ncbi:MAG: hypothetical protein LBR87_03140 [Synergistaceae bacterium]|jgi:hypothetical protein|nr:hypothetical protein [Synergistaceae bacterium]